MIWQDENGEKFFSKKVWEKLEEQDFPIEIQLSKDELDWPPASTSLSALRTNSLQHELEKHLHDGFEIRIRRKDG